MELLIIAVVILALGAVFIFIAFAPGSARRTSPPPVGPDEAAEVSEAEEIQPAETQPAMTQPATTQPAEAERPATQPGAARLAEIQEGEEAEPVAETAPAVSVAESYDEPGTLLNPLQLKAAELIAAQIDRLQAEYLRMGEERERLAQELLTSWLVDKFEETSGPLKTDVKREAQDLRQQLVRVSAEFERAQYRLTSLQNLQARLDDPRIARQIDDLVTAVKHLARVR